MSLPPDPRTVYTAGDPVETEHRALKHALVGECRRLIDHIALLDAERTGAAELDRLVEQARDLADRLESMPSLRRFGGLAVSGPEDAALLERSGISGRSNPLAPPLHLEMTDGVTRGHAVYGTAYEGPPGCLHGGFVAAAFDDMMGFAQMASGFAGFTGTLTVKMRRPTPLYRRIDFESGLDRVDGRKIFCWGKSWDGDTLLCEATILFIAPRGGLMPG
jgi:acyl-coenzyme A thioesterase PaaI-like protein